jgi:hypothetical protein
MRREIQMATEADKPQPSLWDLLERRYGVDQGWLLFYEVPNRTGFKGDRSADALALSTWPSQGICLHGFEVKRSRSDLLKELRDETKAAAFKRYCHYWWLTISDTKLAEGVEVPDSWASSRLATESCTRFVPLLASNPSSGNQSSSRR